MLIESPPYHHHNNTHQATLISIPLYSNFQLLYLISTRRCADYKLDSKVTSIFDGMTHPRVKTPFIKVRQLPLVYLDPKGQFAILAMYLNRCRSESMRLVMWPVYIINYSVVVRAFCRKTLLDVRTCCRKTFFDGRPFSRILLLERINDSIAVRRTSSSFVVRPY